MWHEARKQEKKIRGMMVDYRKRAERRRDFYEKFVSLIFLICIDKICILEVPQRLSLYEFDTIIKSGLSSCICT